MGSKRLTKREADALLDVTVGSPTCLDAKDAAAGRGRQGFTHVELRAYLSPKASELLDKKRLSKTAYLPTGKRRYEAELKSLSEELRAESSEKIRREAVRQGLIAGADGAQALLERATAYIEAKGVLTKRQSKDYQMLLEGATPLHRTALEDITVEDVEACVIAVRDSPRGGRWAGCEQTGEPKKQAAYTLLCFIRNVLDDAAEKGVIEENVADSKALRKAFPRPRADDVDPFLPEEQARLRRAIFEMPHDWRRIAFWILLSCGLRPQEVLALQFQDLVLSGDEPTLHVRRAADGEAGGIKETKTYAGCRAIPLDPLTVRILREWEEDRRTFAAKAGVRFGGRWFVCSPNIDRNACRNSLNEPWRRLMASLEGEVPYRNKYQLRHSFATTLLREKVDIMTVSHLLGHADPEVTLRRYIAYVHASSVMATRRLMEALDGHDDLSWYLIEGSGRVGGS